MPPQNRSPLPAGTPDPRQQEEDLGRVVAAVAGGSLLGGALFSVPGAMVGGLLGMMFAAVRNDEVAKTKARRRRAR
jgi:hypothetical protein